MSLGKKLVPLVKKCLRIDEHNQKPRAVYLTWEYFRDLYHHHPRERFLNFIETCGKRTLGVWKIMPIPKTVLHRVFHIYVAKSGQGKQVIKIPLGNNENSCRVLLSLRSPEAFEKYCAVLQGTLRDPWLKNHCVAVSHVRRDGGYISEFVAGVNLADIQNQILRGGEIPKSLRDGLIKAIDQLLLDLAGYTKEHGSLIGDWPFHNLIFCEERATLVNVDAEGFFTWFGEAEQSHLPLITANCRDFVQLLKLVDSSAAEDAQILDTLRTLDEVRRSDQQYSGRYFLTGYHSLELRGMKFRGQRDCAARLAQVPFDFQNKTVLDLGCNCGGMLHALSGTIKAGRGLDFNPKCVNAANRVKALNQSSHLEFFLFDLDHDDLSRLTTFLPDGTADICFLLSLCMWLERWREVVRAASSVAKTLLFESNGTPAQQDEQRDLLHTLYRRVQLLADNSPDDFLQSARRLYLCSND